MNSVKVAAALVVVLVAGGLLVGLLSAFPTPTGDAVETPWIGPYLWNARGLDLIVQALLVFAGVLGVLLVLGPREGEG
ncbi:MAG: hypothetical protein A3K65_08780 [Euryarchaeota archaeon RBG_16_68_12]|nr:MAG: hypothetical protein A3K65_08780 [Euryarchaeota archaeon RBG_16_68_12]